MKLNHVALVCSSEQRADDFYAGVLELRRIRSFVLSRELARQIFEIDDECRVLVYGDSRFTAEVFLATPAPGRETNFEHIGVEVKNIEEFVKRCEAMQVEVNRVPKGDRLLTFVKDYDGNLFEIKEAPL
jgi:catechol 2,3-dioxygenase-like lactoylglutathione lyase family enzyme